jgi:NADPH:quinone reductase
MLALYGEASGLVPPIDPRELLLRKSLFLTRAGLDHYIADRAELRSRTDEIFSWIAQGRLKQKSSASTGLKLRQPAPDDGAAAR